MSLLSSNRHQTIGGPKRLRLTEDELVAIIARAVSTALESQEAKDVATKQQLEQVENQANAAALLL